MILGHIVESWWRLFNGYSKWSYHSIANLGNNCEWCDEAEEEKEVSNQESSQESSQGKERHTSFNSFKEERWDNIRRCQEGLCSGAPPLNLVSHDVSLDFPPHRVPPSYCASEVQIARQVHEEERYRGDVAGLWGEATGAKHHDTGGDQT